MFGSVICLLALRETIPVMGDHDTIRHDPDGLMRLRIRTWPHAPANRDVCFNNRHSLGHI